VPTILIECKHWGQNLNLHDNQLLRYFHVSKAKFGILTNGIVYRFYSDLVEPNKMDEKPFLEFNITDIKENQIEELKKFHKSVFDAEKIINTASELKYMNELKLLIHQEFTNPSPDLVKLFAKQVYPSNISAKVLELFTTLTKRSIQQYISDLITERLKTALSKEDEALKTAHPEPQEAINNQKEETVTTDEELEGFTIVKAILRQKVNASRITYRDAKSYFAIMIDDNNRKSICRLYFNSNKKFISYFDDQKKEIKQEINTLDDIFEYAEHFYNTLNALEKDK